MRILLSNDDGVFAEGINVLYDTLRQLHTVTVVAPDRNCSGASSSLTLLNPLRVTHHSNGFMSVNGTPTDSVHLGFSQIVKPLPDMVVAGINHGANLGDDIVYSGTVAAAIEGRHLGLPAIAVSLVSKKPKHFETAAHVTTLLIKHLINNILPSDQIININVPDIPLSELKGIKVTRLGRRHQPEGMKKMQDPWQRDIYWYGVLGAECDAEIGTDFHAVANGYASITPLTIDMTAYKNMASITKWVSEITL